MPLHSGKLTHRYAVWNRNYSCVRRLQMNIWYFAQRGFKDSYTPGCATFLSAGNIKNLFNYTVIRAFCSLLLHSEGRPWKPVLLAGGGKRVQNMGSVYSLEGFIRGSRCLLLGACMAVSLQGHAGILDNRTYNSFFWTVYTSLFCFSSSRNTATQE